MIRGVRWIAAVIAGLVSTALGYADDSKLKVKEGDKFPVVALTATQIDKLKPGAKEASIADLKGKNVVVVFYPKANTGG